MAHLPVWRLECCNSATEALLRDLRISVQPNKNSALKDLFSLGFEKSWKLVRADVLNNNWLVNFRPSWVSVSTKDLPTPAAVADLLAALDHPPPPLPVAQPSSPSRNPLIDTPRSPGPVDSDLRECTYREVRREQPLFNLPPFEAMMEYWSNLEQGLVRAAEVRSCPSYII
jgi:hypothetical protein